MERFLWLAFERPPHPDAVVAAVGERELPLVIDLLRQPYAHRLWYAGRFRNALKRRPPGDFESAGVICRSPDGVCHVVGPRLAKWLSRVLPADAPVADHTARRLETWLQNDPFAIVVQAKS